MILQSDNPRYQRRRKARAVDFYAYDSCRNPIVDTTIIHPHRTTLKQRNHAYAAPQKPRKIKLSRSQHAPTTPLNTPSNPHATSLRNPYFLPPLNLKNHPIHSHASSQFPVSYWPSRDPIGERGGVNLYGFVGNNSIGDWDYLGYESRPTDADWDVNTTFTSGEEPCNHTAILKDEALGEEAGKNVVDRFGVTLGDAWVRKHRSVLPKPSGGQMIPATDATFRWTAKIECIDNTGKEPKVVGSDEGGGFSGSVDSAVTDAKSKIKELGSQLSCPSNCCKRSIITITREKKAGGGGGDKK